MKRVFPALLAALLLSACPDSRVPKPPPRVPEPRMVGSSASSPALSCALLTQGDADTVA